MIVKDNNLIIINDNNHLINRLEIINNYSYTHNRFTGSSYVNIKNSFTRRQIIKHRIDWQLQ